MEYVNKVSTATSEVMDDDDANDNDINMSICYDKEKLGFSAFDVRSTRNNIGEMNVEKNEIEMVNNVIMYRTNWFDDQHTTLGS